MNVQCKIFDTDRLYLRQIHMQDLSFLTELHQDPEVMKYLGPLRTSAEMKTRIARIMCLYQMRPGNGIWLLCKKAASQPIGWACLKDLDGSERVEIGYRISSQFWRKGFATEVALGLLNFGFQHLGLIEISGVSRPKNRASIAVLRKCGMTEDRIGHYYNFEMVHFKISKSSWKSRRSEDQNS